MASQSKPEPIKACDCGKKLFYIPVGYFSRQLDVLHKGILGQLVFPCPNCKAELTIFIGNDKKINGSPSDESTDIENWFL